ncbi:hypothetical protein [Rhizobium tumorigenes]|uniref:Uncharacterized protein n=1 Tax=Rhizobium tumorigenes TaxID=2041385 RepID=A0AAF1KJJ7_9HYPH|nr:hypothetical protein [Rhizobium tumorigenes]WFR96210.1 hypothetical protein PR017_03460 [Rhizobium tumorigenes]WFS01727.1 hypothetical protein PR016_03595 [Rhizobium tumorigenes]
MTLLLNSAFTTDDVDVLRGALDCWYAERRIDLKSTEAQFAAAAALDLFQSGYDTRDRLLVALRSHSARQGVSYA